MKSEEKAFSVKSCVSSFSKVLEVLERHWKKARDVA